MIDRAQDATERRPVGVADGTDSITVVCSDGSVFRRMKGQRTWTEVVPIPGTPAAFAQAK